MKKVVFMSVLSLFLLTGCYELTGGIILDSAYYNSHPSPPAHAPAHGRRAHRYHYYPNAEFYFDTGRNMYYFLDSSAQWTFSVTLPYRLRHHLHNNYVEIEMDDERPYRRHKHYRNKYKRHNTKYRRKYDKRQLNYGNRKHKYDSRTLNDGTRKNGKRKYDSRILDDGNRNNRKRKYDSRTLNDGTRTNRKRKYDSRSLDNGSRNERRYKKEAKKYNQKYRDDDEKERNRSKGSTNKRNKHGLHE